MHKPQWFKCNELQQFGCSGLQQFEHKVFDFPKSRIVAVCADSLHVLPAIQDGCVNLILTDPPYNVSRNTVIARRGGKFGKAKDIVLDFGEWDHGSLRWQDWIDEAVRVLDRHGVFITFYNKLEIGGIGQYLERMHGFKVRHIGAWIKTNPAPQARKVKWQEGVELFLIATKNTGVGHHFNYQLGQSPDYYLHSVTFKHLHPTQKPLQLIEWLVNYWSFPGDLVLDPFAGAFTTAVACARLGRNCIAVEIDKRYYEAGINRLESYEEVVPCSLSQLTFLA